MKFFNKRLTMITASAAITLSLLSFSAMAKTVDTRATSTQTAAAPTITWEKSLSLLESGNKRFVTGKLTKKDFSKAKLNDLTVNGQKPFATIISCADSRVPPEHLFDQGLGDVFIARNAGNVIDDVTLGTVEYGAEHLGTPLIVVMGHTKCGACKATVDSNLAHSHEASVGIESILSKIKPSFEEAYTHTQNTNALYTLTEDLNIENSIQELEERSPILKELVEQKKVKIVGAKYDISTGKVTFEKSHD
ncbi:MAG: carbonic anhydrase [Clostridia bacterium]|nr:carbonic anhydrase [Clostridia bacterium]